MVKRYRILERATDFIVQAWSFGNWTTMSYDDLGESPWSFASADSAESYVRKISQPPKVVKEFEVWDGV